MIAAAAERIVQLRRTGGYAAYAVVAGALGLSALTGLAIVSPQGARVMLAATLLLLLVGVGHQAPRQLLFALVVWLVVVGGFRRVFSELSPGGAADPLLLVGPVAMLTLLLTAFERGAFAWHTRLSRLVAAFSIVVLLGAVNPLQGGLLAGISGLIFFVPLAMFWVGRVYCDDATLTRLLVLIGVLSLPAAAYGLYQVFSGFPLWDQQWINGVNFASLSIEGAVRPFSMFSSSAEFGAFLGVAVAIWFGLTARALLVPVMVVTVAFLVTAVVYQSSRGTLVMIVISVGIMLGARRRMPLSVSLAAGAALLLLLPTIVAAAAPASYGGDASSKLVAHQVDGLSDPLDPDRSTATVHLDLLVSGVKSALTNPFGHGIASVTRAGAKFGGLSAGTEADPSNVAFALGLIGLVIYVLLFAAAYSRLYRVARSGDAVAVAALGVVTVLVFQWLNGGQYSVAFLPWLIFGWCDRRLSRSEQARAPAESSLP